MKEVGNVKASEEIRKTKELLMEVGWVQGEFAQEEYFDEDEDRYKAVGYCVLGAHGEVKYGDYNWWEHRDCDPEDRAYNIMTAEATKRYLASHKIVDEPLRERVSVAHYNDMTGVTFNDICDFLDVCEKQAMILEEVDES